MRYLQILGLTLFLFSCKREYTPIPHPAEPVKKVLLKDLTIPNLPSPYYHFEYTPDSLVARANFASSFTLYDILYSGGRIKEMRNNIIVNHDTLRYIYDLQNKVIRIDFINQSNITYRHAGFSYSGNKVTQIVWDRRDTDIGFIIDRKLQFEYYADGNLKTITETRRDAPTLPWYGHTTLYEQYDDKTNVDDFSLVHDGIHDHLFLFQGFRLQKNNPKKETFTGGEGSTFDYTVNYTYTYNNDGTPSQKLGELLFTRGPQVGQKFPTHTFYTYY